MKAFLLLAAAMTAFPAGADAQSWMYESGPGGSPPVAYGQPFAPPPAAVPPDYSFRAPSLPQPAPTTWSVPRPYADPDRQSTLPEPPAPWGGDSDNDSDR